MFIWTDQDLYLEVKEKDLGHVIGNAVVKSYDFMLET